MERYCTRPLSILLCFAVLVTVLEVSASGAKSGSSAYIRVNQVGYLTSATKRAYLMSTGSEAGATFSIKNLSGSTVYTAAIGANQGKWGTFSYVYALDFDSFATVGTYTISVASPIAATSPSFKIDSGTNVYSTPLANSLFYYETSRDGPNYIANSLRTAPGHLNDETASAYYTPSFDKNDNAGPLTATGAVLDASGGWWDAGDYLKFVETHSYTVAMMLVGVRDFPGQVGNGSAASNFTAEAQFGLDWLQKMWVDSSQTLYYQTGVASGGRNYTGDHDIWRLPQADDNWQGCTSGYQYICHRPVFLNTAGGSGATISPNIAGRLAADFALCYKVFAASNTAYANQCLISAEHIFNLANTNPSGNLLTTGPWDFYPEVEWRDDMELGATELYFALQGATNLPSGLLQTNPTYYLTAAAQWANAYITGPNDAADTLNLYDVSGLAHYELYRAFQLAGNPTGLATTEAALLADLKKQLDKAVTQAGTDPFGFGFTWANWDTTSHGGGLVVMANEYDYLTTSSAYANYGSRWQANVLGANAWGTSLIVGDGTTFPLCMQHQVTNLVPVPPNGPPFLYGAVVEGPNSAATKGSVANMVACPPNGVDQFAAFNGNGSVFKDNVQSYDTVEPAIDLTASSFLGFAWQMAGSPSGTP
ncbi:MAG TPA: glycoside hydrolase family 9 protein [Candidatus Sulfotelmatobacter sp.]|nr:glycoside hydrolase family 9 protein [Candidatus Sulfotelmatobacter sp.]